MYKYVPQEMMPEEYGGQCGTMEELQGNSLLCRPEHINRISTYDLNISANLLQTLY